MFFEKEYNAGRQPSKPSEWMEPMKRKFYNIMGWDEQGRPTAGKLTELGIVPQMMKDEFNGTCQD
jgi:aldehyde:ferredoxin oxidoreductase